MSHTCPLDHYFFVFFKRIFDFFKKYIFLMSKNTQFTILKTCNHYLKILLTLKAQFENIFNEIFWDIF